MKSKHEKLRKQPSEKLKIMKKIYGALQSLINFALGDWQSFKCCFLVVLPSNDWIHGSPQN